MQGGDVAAVSAGGSERAADQRGGDSAAACRPGHADGGDVSLAASSCLHEGLVVKCDEQAGRLTAEVGKEAEGWAERVRADPVLPALGGGLGRAPVVAVRLAPDLATSESSAAYPEIRVSFGNCRSGTSAARSRLMKWNQRACLYPALANSAAASSWSAGSWPTAQADRQGGARGAMQVQPAQPRPAAASHAPGRAGQDARRRAAASHGGRGRPRWYAARPRRPCLRGCPCAELGSLNHGRRALWIDNLSGAAAA
jgi:hypothetical protein